MIKLPPCYGIIPARYGSTRFPAKALADILGRPMFWHVWNRARRCPALLSVTLATDDERIAEAAAGLNVPCVMTSREHQSGTDRVFEAAVKMKLPENAVIANIQGDEPALNPSMLDELLAPFRNPQVRVTTLARFVAPEEAASPDQVKVVTSSQGDALYFSRAAIPFDREALAEPGQGHLGHIGLYAFRYEALKTFTSLPSSYLERREKLEQLRLLENGIPIRVMVTREKSCGVDRPEDLAAVIALLRAEADAEPKR